MFLSEIICFLTKAGGCFWRSLSQMKTQECIKHLHFNFSLLLYLSPQLWGLYPKGCTCQDEGWYFPLITHEPALWGINFSKQNSTQNKTNPWKKITQNRYSYSKDNCCLLTSRPDPSSDLIAALASNFSSYLLISGTNPKSKAARIR